MRVLTVALFVACLAASQVSADIWTSCGKPTDDFKIGTVKITPDPPVIGQDIVVAVSGSLNRVVSSGSVALTLKYGSITLINQNVSLCTIVDQTGYKCPLPQGPLSVQITQSIPSIAPPGGYSGHVVINDQLNNEVACVDLSFTMSAANMKEGNVKKMA